MFIYSNEKCIEKKKANQETRSKQTDASLTQNMFAIQNNDVKCFWGINWQHSLLCCQLGSGAIVCHCNINQENDEIIHEFGEITHCLVVLEIVRKQLIHSRATQHIPLLKV